MSACTVVSRCQHSASGVRACRYLNQLDPNLNHGRFTPLEEAIIFRAQQVISPSMLSYHVLPGRSAWIHAPEPIVSEVIAAAIRASQPPSVARIWLP